MKSSNFECKYWKPHVSSFIRSWDIAFYVLDLSPWVPLMGNHKSVTIHQKMVVCGRSHLIWMDISIANHVRMTSYCYIVSHSSVVSIERGGVFDLRSKRSSTDESERSHWLLMTKFHGEQLVWQPSWLSRSFSFGWKHIFRQLDCANRTSINNFVSYLFCRFSEVSCWSGYLPVLVINQRNLFFSVFVVFINIC